MSTTKTVTGTELFFEQLFIPSDTPGIELHLRNKRPATMTAFSAEKTIVMVHGASFSSGSLYDVSLGGLSFMDYLAAAGYDVYGLDVRGYGLSTRPPEMEQPADENPPVGNTGVAIADLATAVDYVLERRGIEKVNIFGMSWGGTVVGAYTSANNDKVHKLTVLAPQWVSDVRIPLDPGGPLDSYRLIPVRESESRWLNTAPEHGRDTLIPEGWFEQWADTSLAEDPWSTGRAPDSLRASSGPIQDIRDYWNADRRYYEPSQIRVPVLLIHGEWDFDVPINLALAFFGELKNAPYRRWVEIGEATHLALMEKNRLMAFKAVQNFFDESFVPER
ncbi:MAG: alpha/beta fold hydrolase [Rubrobacteraceae bacterium]